MQTADKVVAYSALFAMTRSDHETGPPGLRLVRSWGSGRVPIPPLSACVLVRPGRCGSLAVQSQDAGRAIRPSRLGTRPLLRMVSQNEGCLGRVRRVQQFDSRLGVRVCRPALGTRPLLRRWPVSVATHHWPSCCRHGGRRKETKAGFAAVSQF